MDLRGCGIVARFRFCIGARGYAAPLDSGPDWLDSLGERASAILVTSV